jgi:DNA-binding NarL/FixJ family response regulator
MKKTAVIGKNETEREAVIAALSAHGGFQVAASGTNWCDALNLANPSPDITVLVLSGSNPMTLFSAFLASQPVYTSHHRLSDLEIKIVNAIAMGICDKKIASDLDIATNTVRNCMTAIRRKTGLQERVLIVLYALMAGIIEAAPVRENILSIMAAHKKNQVNDKHERCGDDVSTAACTLPGEQRRR